MRSISGVGQQKKRNTEDTMNRFLRIVLGTMLMVGMIASQWAVAKPQKAMESKSGKEKQTQWQGHVVRLNTNKSTMSIRGGRSPKDNFERQVAYDATTQWTKQGQAAD